MSGVEITNMIQSLTNIFLEQVVGNEKCIQLLNKNCDNSKNENKI